MEERTDKQYSKIFNVFMSSNLTILTLSTGTLGPAVFGLTVRDSCLAILGFNIFCTIFPAYFCTWGPKLGMRQMILARYTFGYYGVIVPCALNLLTGLGFAVLNCILGGQTLASVTDGRLSWTVGIVIFTLISLFVSFWGYKFLHWYERFAWIPILIAFMITVCIGGKRFTGPPTPEPVAVAGIMDFAGVQAGFMITWSGFAADYGSYIRPDVPSWKIFWAAYGGLFLSAVSMQCLGAAITATATSIPAWDMAFAGGNIGGLLDEILQPLGDFGKFLTIILSLSVTANLVSIFYSSSLSFQVLIPSLVVVPRYVFSVVTVAVVLPVSIVGAHRFYDTITNFLGLIGYWASVFVVVLIIEHLYFRRGDFRNYDAGAWDKPKKLPPGFAALGAGIICFGLVIPCMSQVWFTGPIAKGTGDFGFEVALLISALLYPPLRWIEIREASIASQLLEDRDHEMTPLATETAQDVEGEANEVAGILQDSEMVPSTSADNAEAKVPSTNDDPSSRVEQNASSAPLPTSTTTDTTCENQSIPEELNEASAGMTASTTVALPTSPPGVSATNLPPTYPPIVHPDVMTTVNAMDGLVGEPSQDMEGVEGGNNDGEVDEEEEEDELSDGDDLRDDLEEALDDSNFSFQGSFYHASVLVNAPNPCLHISGLGLVGLPLSKRDAKALMSCATMAAFGHGERTVVDKEVRDTWEIEPSRVMFVNQGWEQYINGVVCHEVCKSLGVTIWNTPPRMELYKLLLYEKGSHFLPHQDTQKTNGMFATVIIILPSAYTGGEVVVSHAGTTKTIDFAPNSLLSTGLLGWYTDVRHEVKPVTSGYRLALSYNVINTAPPGVPMPCLPELRDQGYSLRRVLKKWKEDRYADMPEPRLVAYLLEHQYSQANLKEGIRTLKGADLARVRFLREVAEKQGFMVGLASLSHTLYGSADDYGGGYHRRGRWDSYSDDEDTPEMLEVESTVTKVSGIVDLDGHSLLPVGSVDVGEDALIPRDPFDDETPDGTEYEGYMGNYAGTLEHWYRRTAFVLMYQDDVDDICFSVGGLSYALQKLKRSTAIPPTTEDRLWVDRLLQKSTSLDKGQVSVLLDYALKWRDADMCKRVMKCPSCPLTGSDLTILIKIWKTFSFETVRLSFEEILARSKELKERIYFIYSLPPHAQEEEKAAVAAWCKKESDKVLSSYTTPDAKDVPTLIFFIRVAGLDSLVKVIIPNLLKKKSFYAFWITLIKALHTNKQAILSGIPKAQNTAAPAASPLDAADSTPANQPSHSTVHSSENVVDELVKVCLQAALPQWSTATTQAPTHYGYYGHASTYNASVPQTTKVDRIIEILQEALTIADMDICRQLFVDILQAKGTSAEKFKQVYNALIPRLQTLLSSRNLDICSAPFVDLLQVLIGTYMRDILGKKGQLFNCRLRKIGCGCGDCGPLDRFILDPSTTSTTFRLAQARRQHLERQIAAASDLCTYTTIRYGSPHGLQVTKRPEVVQASQWTTRQKEAKAFLATIGSDEKIKKIMGVRYADVVNAINGHVPFGAAQVAAPAVSATTAAAAPMQTGVSSGLPSTSRVAMAQVQPMVSNSTPTMPVPLSATSAPARVAGKKRKSNPIILGPVIDLAGENSDG
ncbi:hypothetical protein NLJ89_g4866 [Agrocybe chaxingu]|uniref:Fe2OG dioxygenase domain-containing protein n=1 Tax=Agrocybe chaxingu TaxID=84603 RepID=A0A9W8K872_9AGAR|nr:hypothetical protein NLJ89_g4866 [Agrocybe chaxingu]